RFCFMAPPPPQGFTVPEKLAPQLDQFRGSGPVGRLADAMREAMSDAKVQDFFNGTATVLWPMMGPDQLQTFVADETPRIASLIARSNLRGG
ncbi:hypothetical protein, partial [Belnapia rosea]|uniref:hypothetical protein n=1 Tax=Belnapia rosea TaxID=938405 RepID=UPI001C40B95E